MGKSNRKRELSNGQITVWVAVIGAVGVLGGALITGYFNGNKLRVSGATPTTSIEVDSGNGSIQSPTLNQENNKSSINNEFIQGGKTENHTKYQKVDSSQSSTTHSKFINNGTNNGIMGDNNVIQAPPQPRPSEAEITNFIKLHPDRGTMFEFHIANGNRTAEIYTSEFIQALNGKGYKYISLSFTTGLYEKKTGIYKINAADSDSTVVAYFFNL